MVRQGQKGQELFGGDQESEREAPLLRGLLF